MATPYVGAGVEAWWSGASCASDGPTTAPGRRFPGSTHAESRTPSATGRDTQAVAQHSRRWLAWGNSRATVRYSVGGLGRRAAGPCRGLTSIGRTPHRIDIHHHCISTVFTVPYRYLRYAPKCGPRLLRGRSCLQADSRKSQVPILSIQFRYPLAHLTR